jgi:hypothetical protein
MACYLVAADCSIFIVKTFVGQPNSISLKVLALNVTFRADCWVWLVQSFPADASRYTSPFWSFTILSFSAQAPPRHAPLVALCPRSGSSPRRHFVPDCHYLCAIATISGCRATIMSRQVSQRLSLMIPPSPNVANDYLHSPRRMGIWEVLAHQASAQVSCTHSDLNEPSRRLAFFPVNFKVCIKMPLKYWESMRG